jgi:AcrR family transcriptional regulator
MPSQAATDRILDSASKLFYQQGIRATGVDRIAADSGMTKTTLYACFGSKEELVRAYLARRDQRWRDWFKSSIERHSSRDPVQRPLAIFDALAERLRDPAFRGCAFINAMAELDREHPGYVAATEHKTRVQDFVRTLLEGSGYADAGSLAKRFMLLIDGALVTAYRQRTPNPARQAGEIAATLLSGWPKATAR